MKKVPDPKSQKSQLMCRLCMCLGSQNERRWDTGTWDLGLEKQNPLFSRVNTDKMLAASNPRFQIPKSPSPFGVFSLSQPPAINEFYSGKSKRHCRSPGS